jgi:O-antigen/teichoic acid export membrane protein
VSQPRTSLTLHAIKGVLWTGLAMGTQALLQIVAMIVMARLLSPSAFGLFAASLLVIGFGSIFSELGVGPAIVQRPDLEERHIRVAFTLSLLMCGPVVLLIWFGAPIIAGFFRMPELMPIVRVICAVCICHAISLVAEALAQRALRFRWLAGVDAMGFGFGFIIIGPALALAGWGVWALVAAQLAQHGIRTLALLVGQPHSKRLLLDREAAGHLLYFGGGFTLARIGNYLAGHGDNLVVGHMLGAQALGLYAHAFQLMSAPAVLVGQVMDRVLFPTMALVQLSPVRLAQAYRNGISVCALLILPASLIVAIVAPEIIAVLLGPAWMGVVGPFQILAVGMLFRTSYKLGDSVARATGAVYNRAWRQAVFALAVLLGSLVGQLWGVVGVAAGVFVAIALNFALMAGLSLRLTHLGAKEFLFAHGPALALSSVTVPVAWTSAQYLRDFGISPLVTLLNVGLASACTIFLLCWIAPVVFLGRDAQSILRIVLPAGGWWIFRRFARS